MDHPQPEFTVVYERMRDQRVCFLGRFETAEEVEEALGEYGQVDEYSVQVPEGEVYAAIWNSAEEPLHYEMIYLNKAGTWVGSGPQSLGANTVLMWNPDTARIVLFPEEGSDARESASGGSYRSYSIVPNSADVEAARRFLEEERGGAYGMRLHSPGRYSS